MRARLLRRSCNGCHHEAHDAAGDCWQVVTGTVSSLGNLFRGRSTAQASGAVGIVRTSAQHLGATPEGRAAVVSGTAGPGQHVDRALQLLPLLPLDGGSILFSLIEGVRGRAVPQAVYQRFSAFGIGLLALVMVIALSNDIGHPLR
jgi:hypothetical protein